LGGCDSEQNNRNHSGERSVPLSIMNRCRCSCRCSARLLESNIQTNSKSSETDGSTYDKNNTRVSVRLRIGVPRAWHFQQSYFTRLATVHEPHTDSHHAGVRRNCNPAISTAYTHAHAQDSFRRYAEEDVKYDVGKQHIKQMTPLRN
jgi:hypothetical protein